MAAKNGTANETVIAAAAVAGALVPDDFTFEGEGVRYFVKPDGSGMLIDVTFAEIGVSTVNVNPKSGKLSGGNTFLATTAGFKKIKGFTRKGFACDLQLMVIQKDGTGITARQAGS